MNSTYLQTRSFYTMQAALLDRNFVNRKLPKLINID